MKKIGEVLIGVTVIIFLMICVFASIGVWTENPHLASNCGDFCALLVTIGACVGGLGVFLYTEGRDS